MVNWDDPKEWNEYHRIWRRNHPNYHKRYDKTKKKEYDRKRLQDPIIRKKGLERAALRYKNLKFEVFNNYSNYDIKCNCCKEFNINFLTLDHINGNGSVHRKEIGLNVFGGGQFYDYLKKNNYPKGYQVLCFNCNISKKNKNLCYHERSINELIITLTIKQKYLLKFKYEVMKFYSKGIPYCKCCGENEVNFLSIDHINGNGRLHRKSLNIKNSIGFYKWLIKENFPDGFQILCYNCNCGKGNKLKCPHELELSPPISLKEVNNPIDYFNL